MMRNQTDLAEVKQTARALLYTEIHETEFSPMIVTHPFTDSGITGSAQNYSEALNIIGEYVNITAADDVDEDMDEGMGMRQ